MKVFVTRKFPDRGLKMIEAAGYEVSVSPHNRILTPDELLSMTAGVDAVLTQLTDKITKDVLTAWKPTVKIVANYAVGFDNIDIVVAKELGIAVTNTPGLDLVNETVAEHAISLMLALMHRVVEGDKYMRSGSYVGWEPELLLGDNLSGSVLGILGLGRIGARMAHHAVRGFDMKAVYYDVVRNEKFENEMQAEFKATPEEVLKMADVVSIHVPLLPSTYHLINAERLRLMKPTAYLVNTSRGPVIDEHALAEALHEKVIRGAALDVFENEPLMDPLLKELSNVIVTPHIASATEEVRQQMGEVASRNIIAVLEGKPPLNPAG